MAARTSAILLIAWTLIIASDTNRLAAQRGLGPYAVDRLLLTRGAIHVDADPARPPRPLAVDTPFGLVSHIGTQFELRLDDRSLGVRVREGEVAVESRQGRVTAGVVDALRLTTDRPVERSRISTSGAEWAWVATLASPFVLEGATVPAFLDWASREQGWRWEYASTSTERSRTSRPRRRCSRCSRPHA